MVFFHKMNISHSNNYGPNGPWSRAIYKLPFELVMGQFVRGRLQNLKTTADTFDHDITPLREDNSIE